MPSKPAQADSIDTGVTHNGEEVAVRARSQHSRSAHVPETDDDGNVVFYDGDGNEVDEGHEDARPSPSCDVTPNTDTKWVLRSTRSVENRDTCRRCFNTEEVKEQNKANGGSVSFARKLRYGDDWGSEESSAKASHTSGD